MAMSPYGLVAVAAAAATAGGGAGGGTGPGTGTGNGHGAGDRRAGGGHQPPLGAEAVTALAAVGPRVAVADEVVQRVAVVGHLLGAVGLGDRAQVTRAGAAGRGHSAGRYDRRPRTGAGTRADRLVHGVLDPEVQRTSRRIRQERTSRASTGRDHGPGGRRAS